MREGGADSANSASSVRNRGPSEVRENGEIPPPPPPDFMQALLAGMAQFAANAANGGGNRNTVPADPFLGALREFERHRTPHFDGSGGYATAEEWLGAVEQSFRLSRTPGAHKAELASTLFERDARHWWATQEPLLDGGVQGTTWTRFVEIFQDRFMGDQQLSNLRSRFESLTQGSLSVR